MTDKAKKAKKDAQRGSVYKYPSHYGSHKSMVVEEKGDGKVICQDEYGKYETLTKNIDSGLADPNRFDLQKRKITIHTGKESDA